MEVPAFSIVIPAYNEEDYLPRTLTSVQEAMAALSESGELIVVDNNSTDSTAEVARQAGAQVVFEPENQIARARNAGASQARAEALIFIDADTLVTPALLRKALDQLQSGDVVGGGAQLAFDEPVEKLGQRGIDTWSRLAARHQLAAGSFFFARQDAFQAVGGFCEQVYAGEEVFLARALKRWAKPRGLRFINLSEDPAITSARKLQWYRPWHIWATFMLLIFFPLALRYRRLCGLWYRRPKTVDAG